MPRNGSERVPLDAMVGGTSNEFSAIDGSDCGDSVYSAVMMTLRVFLVQAGKVLFSLLCLALARAEFGGHPVSSTVVALITLASAPWSLPWLASFLQGLKVGGLLEVNFRQLEQKVEENAKAVAAVGAGVPTRPVGARAAPTDEALAGPDDESMANNPAAERALPVDPNKGRFGGKSAADGRKLTAEVKPFPGSTELFLIHAEVTSTNPGQPLTDGTTVGFFLEPAFSPAHANVKVSNGVATIDRAAWQSFTLGAEVDGVKLELDLGADVPSVPPAFVRRLA
jgi:hypothetical protein